MNYEEKYNEILEWARKNKARLNGVPIEEVLPELKESEDERIKKIITDSVFYQYGAGVEYKDVLDYLDKLKKQKEQKPLLPEDKVKHPLYMEGFEAGKEVGRQCEKVFGKQKEQKPLKVGENAYFDPNTEMWFIKKEQESTEWSEEDERMRNALWNLLHLHYAQDNAQTLVGIEAGKFRSWLKSLRSQSHWKPSEEQMEAFKKYIEEFHARAEAAVGGWNNFDVMIRLYEQLKKL